MSDTALAEAAARPRITPVMWGLRINAILAAVAVFAQPLWIGLLYTGDVIGATIHGIGAGAILFFGLVHLVLSILRWKPGGGSAKQIRGSLEYLGFVVIQAVLGVFQLYPLHFPLGVMMAVGVTGTVRDAWADGKEADS